jgi:predicted phage terminase large subunit-like protein
MDQFPLGDSSVAWIDPSFKGTDYTAISIIKSHFQGIAVVGFTYKKSWNNALDQLVEKLLKYNVKKLAFECNSLGDQPVIMLRQLLKGKGIGVVGVDSTMNKHSKIMAAGSYAHLIHLSKESDQNYINQVVQYEYNAKHDDSPDSLASCMSFIGLIRGK